MDRRSTWACEAARELRLIDIVNGKVKLSPLGQCLSELISPQEYGEPNLSHQVKSFFFALSLQYPEIRVALDLLKRNKKMRWSISRCSKCEMETWNLSLKPPIKPTKAIHFQEGKMFCGKCKSELRSNELSLRHAVTQVLGADYYHSLVMWFNSEILPVTYDPRAGIVMA